MSNLKEAAQQVKQSLDAITAAKNTNDPAQLAHAINEAKTKVDELVKRVEEA
jgi:hypothetical protein